MTGHDRGSLLSAIMAQSGLSSSFAICVHYGNVRQHKTLTHSRSHPRPPTVCLPSKARERREPPCGLTPHVDPWFVRPLYAWETHKIFRVIGVLGDPSIRRLPASVTPDVASDWRVGLPRLQALVSRSHERRLRGEAILGPM